MAFFAFANLGSIDSMTLRIDAPSALVEWAIAWHSASSTYFRNTFISSTWPGSSALSLQSVKMPFSSASTGFATVTTSDAMSRPSIAPSRMRCASLLSRIPSTAPVMEVLVDTVPSSTSMVMVDVVKTSSA